MMAFCSDVQTVNVKISVTEGRWFCSSHLHLEEVIKLTYYWAYKFPLDFIAGELKIGSEHTLVDWCLFAKDVCTGIIKTDNEPIGGPGVEIEIGEYRYRFGKRKCHRETRVDGAWVLVAVWYNTFLDCRKRYVGKTGISECNMQSLHFYRFILDMRI